MTRHFSIPTMLRMTPNFLLREFFERLGHRLLCIDWSRLKERQAPAAVHSIRLLPLPDQDEIEAALASVFELACESGIQAVFEVARQDGQAGIAPDFPTESGPYHKAMWVWLHRPDLFDQAAYVHRVEGLTRWRKRKDLPRVEPNTSERALAELASALSQFLRQEEGRGKRCTVEHFRRSDGTNYFVAYPDDFVHTVTMHDDQGRLRPRSLRQTFEIVFGYHRGDGTLDLFAKVAPPLKPKLERLFGRVILGREIGPKQNGRPYNLNRLKDRYFHLDTDPADCLSALLCKMRLDIPQRGRVTLEPFHNGRELDIYDMFDECLDTESVDWDEVNVSMATFRFEFQPVNGRRAGALTIDVTWPDCCSVKSRRPERIDLTRKYLKRWRIANV